MVTDPIAVHIHLVAAVLNHRWLRRLR